MRQLPEPCQPARLPVPIAVFGLIYLALLSLPNGGSASSEGPANVGSPSTAGVIPASLADDARQMRILERQAQLGNFTTDAVQSLPGRPATASAFLQSPAASRDPRLQRKGGGWELSESFVLHVGADPWAMDGVGFPNIETHDQTIASQYKPYQPVVDWAKADDDEWRPIPAVHCMGLSAQQIAERAARYEREILSYAIEYGVSASLIKAVVTKESCFDVDAVSKVGAEGLMQLMPETARWLKVTDRDDVSQNLSAGIRYLSDLRKRFGTEELALAAYNAGPGNVERHGGIPPFEETQQYVKSVMAFYQRYAVATRFANQRVSD